MGGGHKGKGRKKVTASQNPAVFEKKPKSLEKALTKERGGRTARETRLGFCSNGFCPKHGLGDRFQHEEGKREEKGDTRQNSNPGVIKRRYALRDRGGGEGEGKVTQWQIIP